MVSSLFIRDSNLTAAWVKTFRALMKPGADQRHPATIIIDKLDESQALEIQPIRSCLDQHLKGFRLNQCETVAGTIFPRSMWNPSASDDASLLFKRYEKAWPGIEKCRANRNGVYFRRLTAYAPIGHPGPSVNQLEFIINTYHGGNHRKSALQASIIDPTRDHTNNYQKGFPCLQQISLTPLNHGKLSVSGFYATQYQFEKAYGNYLGLYRLGLFMAKQLGMKLSQVVCSAAVLNRGELSKSKLGPFDVQLQKLAAAAGIED